MLLSLDDIHVNFGAVRALAGVSLHVDGGEVVGVVGALGSGKTTLMRLVAGLEQATQGDVSFDGRALGASPWDARARSGIVFVPADGGLFPALSVAENLMLAEPKQSDGARRRPLYELFPILEERVQQYAGSLSGGEQRQLAIARGALSTPRLLLLDEPLLGLSPVTARSVITLVREMRGAGVAIVVAEERPTEDLEAVADRLIGLHLGHVVPAADVARVAQRRHGATGELDRVDLETIGLPLSTRDRRALQTIAQVSGVPVGELIAEVLHEHVEQHQEVWQ
ncbi:MAG: ATP-binding cassette domain-containing protein [Candidatus Dormibacteraeota bacterium]|nr:ATP-binding cassette domain-containing protein [Candidatus Dormibacteraeota bacterium]